MALYRASVSGLYIWGNLSSLGLGSAFDANLGCTQAVDFLV